MQRYAKFDTEGFPVAFYNDDIYPPIAVMGITSAPTEWNPNPSATTTFQRNPGIPADVVEITEAQWMEFLNYQGLRRWVGGQIVMFTPSIIMPNPIVVYKVDLFRKLSDQEYELLLNGLAQQSARMQGVFNAAQSFRSDAPEWNLLNEMALQLYGANRAKELLTPEA